MTDRSRKSPWSEPPATNSPLDYVPIDAPVMKIKPTQWKAPHPLKRASIAAVVAFVVGAGIIAWPMFCVALVIALIVAWRVDAKLNNE